MSESSSRKCVGLIGLGLIGAALTERFLQAGFRVHVYNRTRQKADPLLAMGAQWNDNPLAVCDRVVISLYTTDVVEEVLNHLAAGLRTGQILVDTTTGDPEQTVRLGRRLATQGVRYLEAPISGSSEQTRRGEVTVIAGGPRETFEACRDLFEAFARKTLYAGEWGTAPKMKLVTNLVLGLNRAALAEGLSFAEAIGLSPQDALDALMESMSYSRIMDTKGRKMVEGDFKTQAKLSQHLKDIRIILEEAKRAGIGLTLTEAHRDLLEIAEAAGYGEADNSAIIRAYKKAQWTG